VLADVFDDLAGLELGDEVWEGGGDWGSEGDGEDEEGGEQEGGCGVVHCWLVDCGLYSYSSGVDFGCHVLSRSCSSKRRTFHSSLGSCH